MASTDLSSVSEGTGSICDAVTLPALWPTVEGKLRTALEGELYLFDFDRQGRHSARWCSRASAEAPLLYLSRAVTTSERSVLSYLLHDAPCGELHDCQQLALRQSEPLAITARGSMRYATAEGWISVVHRSAAHIVLLVYLKLPKSGHTDPIERNFIATLAHELGHRLPAVDLIDEQRNALDAQMTLNSLSREATFLLNAEHRLVTQTPSARAVLDRHDLFQMKGEQFTAVHKDIEDAIYLVASKLTESSSHFRLMEHNFVGREIPVRILDTDENGVQRLIEVGPCEDDAHIHKYIYVTVRTPLTIPREIAKTLQHYYALSESEARLSYYLAVTASLPKTLELLSITRNTGKTHLRKIYEKTGTNSQLELCQLISSLAALY